MIHKVLMVYPKIPTTYWSFEHALPFIGKKSAIPPLGLLTVAAMLPPNYEVRLVDLNVTRLVREDIEEADIVFISAMIIQKESFEEIIALCGECARPVVAGGPYPISLYREIEGVDFFVLDEAELTLPRFLEDLEAGQPQKLYRDSGRPDISRTPVPRFDLIDVGAYDSMPLQYSRGCPYNCEFCDIIEMFGHVQRTKTAEQFLRELDAVRDSGFRGSLFIVDDNFVGNHRKVKELLRSIITWQKRHGFPFAFLTEASIDLARDDELLDLMVEAGFNMVFVGIETPDEDTLAHTQKRQNLQAPLLESVEKIQRRGVEVTGGFILGFDTDAADIFDRQIDFIQQAGIPVAMVGLLNALPNTQLGRRLEKEGRLKRGTITGNNTHTLGMNFVPRMPENTLIDGYKRVLTDLYSPRRYFERCLTLLRRLPSRSKAGRSTSWVEIKALLLSLLRQGFSSYGLCYWRYMVAALLIRPTRFPDAVALAIKGFHFFAITGEINAADRLLSKMSEARRRLQLKVDKIMHSRKRRLAASLERSILAVMNEVRENYGAFNTGIQVHLQQALAEFTQRCHTWIDRLRLLSSLS
ncbi:MAG: B12-binding domain-containing radical SAM protein [Candidatus Altiarchaeota archaeon]|nr:B12-binding domain-containing radical SAM protein [Candidatus Altiarchaeota archaeon]